MRSIIRLLLVFAVVAGLMLATFSVAGVAENAVSAEEISGAASNGGDVSRDTSRDIILNAENAAALNGVVLQEGVPGLPGVCVTGGEDSGVTWRFEAADGEYTLRVTYACPESGNTAVVRSFIVNSETPEALTGLSFERRWADIRNADNEFITDIYGNQLTPQQREAEGAVSVFLYSRSGYSNTPVLVCLQDGENTLTLSGDSGSLSVSEIRLLYKYAAPAYATVSAAYPLDSEAKGVLLPYEAEKSLYKSNAALTGKSDRSSPSVSPRDAFKQVLNVVGGSIWNTVGDAVAWEIFVPESGLYAITLKARKNLSQGYVSYRRLYIDDEIPFDECNSLPFHYDTGWQNVTLGNQDGQYLFYLEEGRHEIKLEACVGQTAPILQDTSELLMRLNSLYLQLLVVIGSSPDVYRDYNLTEKIPEVITQLREETGALQDIYDQMLAQSAEKGSAFVTLDLLANTLRKMIGDPESIPKHYAQFKANLGALASWLSTAKQAPLQLDALYIHTPDVKLPAAEAGFFEGIKYFFQNLMASFVMDYNAIGNLTETSDGSKQLTVWMGGGRDQFQVMKNLLAGGQPQKQGISVDLKLVNTSILLKSVVAGRAPDVMLTDTPGEIINYALRGAVAELDQFPDLDEILPRFNSEATVPFTLGGKLYALPTTMAFNVLYYRKDILADRGIDVPQTWDDVTRTISVLTKSNLEFGLPAGNTTFYSFLMQAGGSVYNNQGSAVAFDGKTGIQAFQKWTGYFADYGQPYSYDFQNRFRTGEMPIGIADYAFCATLSVAAPEISGLWDFTLLPGTEQPNGSVDRTAVLDMRGTLILEQSQKKEAAWEFLKWWTSREIQQGYGNGVERVLGTSGRYTTANIEAMNALPWTAAQKRVLNAQLDSSRAVPEIPGGYIVTRGLDYAFRGVVVEGKPARDTLLSHVGTINNELTTKRIEFGLSVNDRGNGG